MTESKHIVIDARIRRSSTGRYTDRLLEHLQTIGTDHRFTVLLQPDDPWKPVREDFNTVACPFPQFSLNPLNDIKFSWLLNSLKPDLVHFTMTQQPLSYRGNIVTTTHDLTMLRFIRRGKSSRTVFTLKKLGYRTLFYTAHKKSKHIIVPSKFVQQDLETLFPFVSNHTSVTYESSEPPLEDRAERPKEIKRPFILHVGSPFPHKNIYFLIKSFEKILETKPNLILVLAGKKEFYFDELEQWARKRDSYKSIKFTGFISDPELKWLYQNAEAYVLPSLSEGFGLPGLEAMAHGCPLISSNATCMPEIYAEAAEYFDPKEQTELINALTKVLGNEKRRQELVTAGYRQIKHYSWRRMAQQTMDIYNKALI